MQIVVNRASFVEGLSSIKKIIPGKTVVSSVAGVKIAVAESGVVELVGTDLTTNIKVKRSCKTEGAGEILVNCEKLLMMVSSLQGDEVTLSNTDQSSGRILVTDGKSKYHLPIMVGETLPALFGEDETFCTVDAIALRDAITQTIFAADDTSTAADAFPGIYFEIQSDGASMNCVATDRKKLSVCTLSVENAISGDDKEKASFYLPPKSAITLKGFCKDGKCVISRFKKMVTFRFDDLEYNSTLLSRAFPNYQSLVNGVAVTENKLTITTSELLGLLRRASVIAMDAPSHTVKFEFSANRMVVSANSQEYGALEEEALCSYAGEPISICVDAMVFSEMLKCFTQNDVTAFFKEACAPIRLHSGNVVVIFMPLRIAA